MRLRQKNYKKIFASVLALTLAAQSGISAVYAGEYDMMPINMSDVGSFGVDIDMDFAAPGDVFNVELVPADKDATGTYNAEAVSNEQGNAAAAMISNVPVGTYNLTISSDGYIPYTQDKVEIIKGVTAKLELNNSRQKNEKFNANYGIIAVGDVDSNNKIDDEDIKLLTEAAESGNYSEIMDLNNDNAVNIGDITYAVLNKGENVQTQIINIISPENIVPEKGENTEVLGGKIEDLTESLESFVQLKPVAEGKISPENPVEISLNVNTETIPDENKKTGGIVIKPPVNSENTITEGTVIVEDEAGQTYEYNIGENTQTAALETVYTGGLFTVPVYAAGEGKVSVESDGTVVVDLGGQIAVKKVTIKVTGSSTDLVDIAEVEFVNDMASRVPEPELNIPQNVQVTKLNAGDEPAFEVKWDAQVNVKGYEVSVSSNGKEEIIVTKDTTVKVDRFGGAELKTYVPYTIRVRSTDGNWKSPYSEKVEFTMTSDSVPPAPEYVEAKGLVESIKVSWRDMRDTTHYSLFYKEKDAASDFTEIPDLKATTYTIPALKARVTYQVYVVGHNEHGASPNSAVHEATTTESSNVEMPKYKLINTLGERGEITAHISKVEVDPKYIVSGDQNAPVDNDQDTYTFVDDWDTGEVYSNFANPIVTLDQKYTIDTICFSPSGSQQNGFSDARIRYKDESGNFVKSDRCRITRKFDVDNNIYYAVTAKEPITSDTFQLCLNTGWTRVVTIAEMRFYEYDDIEHCIEDLYDDNMHLKLKATVTEDNIKALEERLEIKDEVSNELHPEYNTLKQELAYARELLNTEGLADIVNVDTGVTAKADGHNDFALPLSDNQPLGVVANAKDELIIYVGSPDEAENTTTSLRLVATQNHAEVSKWSEEICWLKVGRNIVTIPEISSSADAENGGSLYVEWQGNANARQYSIRVSGGQSIPVLNVAKLAGTERTNAINSYVEELKTYCSTIETLHNENHKGKEYRNDCIANYTEIVMDNMMYSVPATEVLKGIDSNPANLEQAIAAMEQQIDIFYQNKGLNKNEPYNSTNRYPTQRLNIRYHTMFTGAFMYAGGKHIGIEFGSVPGLFSSRPYTVDEKGQGTGGSSIGWGIAHEIGHVINSKRYVFTEVTNNYFSMLATQQKRIDFQQVYDHVTNGTPGITGGATGLALYWQLHLYYDDFYDHKTFDDNAEQLQNLFFARMDSYARNPETAPPKKAAEGEESTGIALTLTDSVPDNLVRLASAAAEKNLVPFFEAWGYTPNADTIKYAEQFPTEEHKIQYIDYDSRDYRLSGGSGMAQGTVVNAAITTPHDDNVIKDNKVEISLSNTGDSDAMLGYEIIRNGEAVAFVPASETSYTDVITTGNNMVYDYSIIGYDKLLNTTAPADLESVKVKHQGDIGRDNWNASTNMRSENDQTIKADGESEYCEDTYISAITDAIGKGESRSYTGTVEDGSNAEIVIDLGNSEQVTAIKYKGAAADFTVFVSEDNANWTQAKEINYDGKDEQVIYFNQPDKEAEDGPDYMYIYKASYVKLVYSGSSVTVDDINILGPTSDDVELITTGIGTLKTAFVYDEQNNYSIPEGSVVFTGVYKGSPSYNVVILHDQDGNIVNGSQIIMAPDPGNGQLGDVSEGIWVYWITPDELAQTTLPTSVYAELYRVDDAFTLENQRLVSNTLKVAVPADLPPIELSANAGENASAVSFGSGEVVESTEYVAEVKAESANSDALALIAETPSEGEEVPPDAEITDRGFLFTTSEDSRSANVQLKLPEDENSAHTIAFQTIFNLTGSVKAEKVNLAWSDVMENRARYKEYYYNPDSGNVYIFAVADSDILDEGLITIGDISFDSSEEAGNIVVNIQPDSTATVYDNFKCTIWEAGGSTSIRAGVELETTTEETTETTSEAVTEETSKETSEETTDVTEEITEQSSEESTEVSTAAPTQATEASTEEPTEATTEETTAAPTQATEAPTEETTTEGETSDVIAEVVGTDGINFVAGVNSIEYKEIGFRFEANGVEAVRKSNIVYTSLANSTITGNDINKDYLYAFTITDVPDASLEIKVTPFIITLDGEEILSPTKTIRLADIPQDHIVPDNVESGSAAEAVIADGKQAEFYSDDQDSDNISAEERKSWNKIIARAKKYMDKEAV